MLNCDIEFVVNLYKEVCKAKLEDMKMMGTIYNISMNNPEKLKSIMITDKVEQEGKILSMKDLKSIGFKKGKRNGIR